MASSAAAAAAAAIPAAPWSTLSPHAAPYTLRARPPVGAAPPGCQQDGDDSWLIDGNSMTPSAYFGMKSCDTVYPASGHGMHQSRLSSSSGVHVNAYPSSTSSTSGYTWMDSGLKQEQFPLVSGSIRSGKKSTMVTIKCPPNKTLETNNISFGSKSKLSIRENDECSNEAGKGISCRNLEFNNLANDNGSSRGTMELTPVLKPLCIPSAHASSRVPVADDVNPDPSECSVDSPCWRGALSSRVSSLDVLQPSDARSVKQELVDIDAGKASTVQDYEASTEIENLVANKSKQNRSQPHAGLGLSEKPVDVDTNLKNDSPGKEDEHAEYGAGKCNAEHTYCLEVRNNCIKQSGLNIAAPDFIPSSVRKSSSGNGSSSSTARKTSEILKAIKIQSDMLLSNYSDDIELEECDLSIIQSIIDNLQSYHYKARKGHAKVASHKAGLKSCHSQNAVSKSVAVNQNGTCTADKGKGIIISNVSDYSHSPDDFGRNSLTGYQPAPNNLWKELSYKDEHSQVLIFQNLWIDAERANCALKYQLKQTLIKMDQESSTAQNGGGPRNPSSQLLDMGTDPNSSVGLALTCTCPPMLKDYPGARKSPNLIYDGDCIQSRDNNVLSRLKDYVPKNIPGEHFLSDLEETGICRGLQPMELNSSISAGVSSHSYISRRDDILPASCEFGLSDWEHVLKNEIS